MILESKTIFDTNNSSTANNIYRTLEPELETLVSERSSVEILANGTKLELKIRSNDIISMRAALNTWLRLIKISYEVFNSFDQIH